MGTTTLVQTRPKTAGIELRAAEMELGALLPEAADGLNWAWNELVRRYSPLIGTIARNHRLNAADSAEVAQATWMKLVENIGKIEKPECVGAWIATTTRRECLRVLRAARRVQLSTEDEIVAVSPTTAQALPEDRPLAQERNMALRLAYERLPHRCRMLLSLLTGDVAVSYQKLSDLMGMRIGSIGPTRARCLEQLRRIALEYGLSPD